MLTDVFKDKVSELGIEAEVKHVGYIEIEAMELAQNLGLQTGTSGIVAKKLNMEIDNSIKIVPDYNSVFNMEYDDYLYSGWSFELDERLRPFENKAREVGILMTPAIVINGELKHTGSVPRLSKITEWLLELK